MIYMSGSVVNPVICGYNGKKKSGHCVKFGLRLGKNTDCNAPIMNFTVVRQESRKLWDLLFTLRDGMFVILALEPYYDKRGCARDRVVDIMPVNVEAGDKEVSKAS